MTPVDEILNDAQKRLDAAKEMLNRGDWQRGIFELDCASARIFQILEWLNQQLNPSKLG